MNMAAVTKFGVNYESTKTINSTTRYFGNLMHN